MGSEGKKAEKSSKLQSSNPIPFLNLIVAPGRPQMGIGGRPFCFCKTTLQIPTRYFDARSEMAIHKTDIFRNRIKEPLEDADSEPDQAPKYIGLGKSQMECICPGCGKMHIMKMRWIGRGVPRKFCESCRNRETPLDGDD